MKGEAWTDTDIETVKRMRSTGSTATVIAASLAVPRTRNAVIGLTHRLGLTRTTGPQKWTAAEVEQLASLWKGGLLAKDIAPLLNRTKSSVYCQLRKSGLRADSAPRRTRLPATKPGNCGADTIVFPRISRSTEQGAPQRAQAIAKRIAAPPPKPIAVAADTMAGTMRFLDLALGDNCCRYITDDAPLERRLVCGRPTELGSSWCAHHKARVFTVSQPRSKGGTNYTVRSRRLLEVDA